MTSRRGKTRLGLGGQSCALRQCTDAGLTADGVVQIECALRDARGELANGERVISAEIDDGELLGVENGDLSDNAPYRQQRSTFNGRVIVFVRPSGPATVRLSAPGLPDVTLQCGQVRDASHCRHGGKRARF